MRKDKMGVIHSYLYIFLDIFLNRYIVGVRAYELETKMIDPDIEIKSDNDGWAGVIIMIILLGLLVYCAWELSTLLKEIDAYVRVLQ